LQSISRTVSEPTLRPRVVRRSFVRFYSFLSKPSRTSPPTAKPFAFAPQLAMRVLYDRYRSE
jgi:hypothetical protein